jgi:hypothetical protein
MLSFKKYQKFGVEIEFYGIEDYLTRESVRLKLEKEGYLGKGWEVKKEEDMDCNLGSEYRGEITSPILTNNIEDLKELKAVLEETRNLGARANQRCGAHIHFDAERLTHDNFRFLQNLLLLHMCYEDIIFKFAAGRMEDIRKSAYSHAAPLIEKISYYDLKTFIYEDSSYDDFYFAFVEGASRNFSLNLSNLKNGGINTIEFRIPDGTLDEFIWFNNINVFGLMIDHAIKMDSNEREILYKEILRKKEIGFDPEFTNVDRAKEFINLIKRCETDEISFLKQYQKKF